MKPEGNSSRKHVVWQDVMPAKPVIKPPTKRPRHRIKLALPKISIPTTVQKVYRRIIKTRQRKIISVVFVIVALAVIVGYIVQQNLRPTTPPTTTASNASKPASTQGKLVPGTPTYTPLLPTGKTLSDLGGGFVRSDKQPSFIYVDKIGKVQINVSEQPLPDSFKDDPAHEVEALATSFNATQKISLGSNTIYLGSYGQGLQRVIFIKNNLLVLITSSASVTASQWATYVNSLS